MRWPERSLKKHISAARPDCVTFVSCSFSCKDVAAWFSNAATRTPSPDLPLEGYIQSRICIGLDRLHNWLENALWTNVGGKLCQSSAYRIFCGANDAYEYCTVCRRRGWQASQTQAFGGIGALRAFFVMPTMLFSRFL